MQLAEWLPAIAKNGNRRKCLFGHWSGYATLASGKPVSSQASDRKGVFILSTPKLQEYTDMLVYRCYRSNALWFASLRRDAYSVTVRDGLTFKFKEMEMMGWANYWLDRSLEYWRKLQQADAPGAAVCLCGLNAGNTTAVPSVDSQQETDCVCPDCTRRALLSRPAPRAGENAKG